MFGTLSSSQIEQELNNRGYLREVEETPITPIITLPPITPDTVSFVEKYGMLTAIAFVGMFLLAIFPGQTEDV